ALEVAGQVSQHFPDGVGFVDLAPLTYPALALPTIAAALQVTEQGDRTLLETLRQALAGRRLLLVLDNCEQILTAAPEIAQLLASTSTLSILATSRAPWRVRGERVFALEPLPVPDRDHRLPLAALAEAPSVALFVERARAARHDFALTEANAGAIAAICARLDGLPLALELAAARSKVLPPAALLARLEQRLPLLSDGARDLPARQRTLQQAIAWSYDLLPLPEQTLFRRLGVFVGGWTLESAEAVANHDDRLDIIAGLGSLVDKSLIRQTEQPDGEPRFTMLETIREFAAEQLAASGEGEDARSRHARFVVGMVERAEPELEGSGQAAWLDRLDAEHDDLRAAMVWAARHDGMLLARLAVAAAPFWSIRGYLTEGRTWLETALADRDVTPAVRAQILLAAGSVARRQCDWPRATALFAEALAAWQDLGDAVRIAEAELGLGLVTAECGDAEAAVVHYEAALARFRQLGDLHGVAACINSLASIALDRGEYAQAQNLYEEAIALQRSVGNERRRSRSLGALGHVAYAQGDLPRALALYRDSLLGCWAHRDAMGIEGLFATLASVGLDHDHATRATHLLGAAEAVREAAGLGMTEPDRAEYERLAAKARQALGAGAWSTAWAAGRAMPREEAVAAALALADELGRDASTESEETVVRTGG
ncbi:MAG TPA: tetratricopeptide repeat protein, partial [Nitrolancea sp.]|nr:tetratricopeptide repeat protein [Nitrolancea sp.]